ncbi:MAG: aldehyde dehydrogenase [Bacteriovoracaceae bacterium]|nr:aldehyde dehydrogenase [Bacteriovoracaceae bacterium]
MKELALLREASLKGALSLEERSEKLLKLKDVLIKNQERINAALKSDLGKSTFESWSGEIGFLLEEIGHLVKALPELVEPERVSTPMTMQPGKSSIYKEPYGVVLVLAPWNYPVQLALSPMVGAIAAGNRVVVKPSELAPACSVVIEEIIKLVFSPDEVIVVQGGVAETQALLAEKFDYIFFTGSTKVGKIVMKAAAEHLTPVTLELGGKSPCLIDDSANISQTAKRIAWGKWMNAGQTCVAPDYVLVPKNKKDELIAELKAAIKQFYGENPKESPDYGRIISERHLERLISLMNGNQVATGGEYDKSTRYLAPTILDEVNWDQSVMSEEIFGPLLPILTYDSLEDAIRIIKSKPKPLAFYFFSTNSKNQERVLETIPFGGGCVNDTIMHLANGELPFGGVGESGMGAYHGALSFKTFTHHKSVFKQTTLIDVPVRYPPYKGKEGLLKFLMG